MMITPAIMIALLAITVCYNEAVRQRRDYKEKPKSRGREKA